MSLKASKNVGTNRYELEIVVDGEKFDSMKELGRWQELRLLQMVNGITDLCRQKEFILIPAQKDPETGRTLERACKYIADFVYTENGKTVVEDTKGIRTKEYIIKRKLMLSVYGIRIKEI